MLLGYHLLWSWTANVVGTDKQKDIAQENIIKNNYFIGGKSMCYCDLPLLRSPGAVNPRDSDLSIVSDGDHIVFNVS
jgi:hypothetical protein